MCLLNLFCRAVAAFAVALTAAGCLQAQTMRFKVIDANGEALANTVILIPGRAGDTSPVPAIMDQVDKQFLPTVLVVQRGQLVSFPNSDNIRHHVYSFSAAKTFEIRLYAGVPEAPVAFDQAGVVVLGCNIHDGMVGYIVVADSTLTALTDAAGMATIAAANADSANETTAIDRVEVWHPVMASTSAAPQSFPLPAIGSDGVYTLKLDLVRAPPAKRSSNTFGDRYKYNAR